MCSAAKNKRDFAALALLGLTFFPGRAARGVELTLAESVERGWNASPIFSRQLEHQRALTDARRTDRWRRFLPNEPQVQYADNDDGTARVLGVVETVAFPGKSIALARMDTARDLAERSELAARKYDIARGIVDAYLASAVSNEVVEQQKKNVLDLETLLHSLQARYAAGLAAQAEVIVTELQLRQQRADLAAAEDKVEEASRRLKRLLGLADAEPLKCTLSDDVDPRLLNELGAQTADAARADAALSIAEANRRTAAWSQLPDLSLGVARNHYLLLTGSPDGKAVTRSYSIGLTLPFLFPFDESFEAARQRNQAALDRSAAELQKLNAQQDREEAAHEYARSHARLKELREKDLPYAEALMESTFSAYKSGKLGIAELVLARKTLTDLRAQDIQLRASIISSHLRCLKETGA